MLKAASFFISMGCVQVGRKGICAGGTERYLRRCTILSPNAVPVTQTSLSPISFPCIERLTFSERIVRQHSSRPTYAAQTTARGLPIIQSILLSPGFVQQAVLRQFTRTLSLGSFSHLDGCKVNCRLVCPSSFCVGFVLTRDAQRKDARSSW